MQVKVENKTWKVDVSFSSCHSDCICICEEKKEKLVKLHVFKHLLRV